MLYDICSFYGYKYLGTSNIFNTWTYNMRFSSTQYLLRILYLLTQIQMVIVYHSPVLNAGFQDFWCTNFTKQIKC